jgi:hypothetical protein
MRRTILAGLLAVLSVAVMAQEQAAKPIDYETYCKLPDAEAKQAAFRATTAESRGTLIKTQLERWRTRNQSRLDENRKRSWQSSSSPFTPDTYADGPQGEAARIKSRAISRPVRAAVQSGGPHGRCSQVRRASVRSNTCTSSRLSDPKCRVERVRAHCCRSPDPARPLPIVLHFVRLWPCGCPSPSASSCNCSPRRARRTGWSWSNRLAGR